MSKYIQNLNLPDDLQKMSYEDLELLSYEIRDFLINKVSKTGGHLSSNLGIVEISIALQKMFNTPSDKIIYDVGHQAYVHKILTGRANMFDTLRKFKGLSGFPKTSESEYDLFDTGHSSTSISLALGLAAARDLTGEKNEIVSVIGDGALTGGIAYEALNNAGHLDSKIIVLLNDNGMSISPNTGGISKYLGKLRGSKKYITAKENLKKNMEKLPIVGDGMLSGMKHARDSLKYVLLNGVFFEEMGFKYFGPIDGHNIKELCETIEIAKKVNGPVFIHAITKKGKGYINAEKNPNVFHGIAPFDIETGQILNKSLKKTYSNIYGNELCNLAKDNKKIVAVSAAMIEGTGLDKFSHLYPNRSFDVGIAEAHAVSFAAGLAKNGYRPFVSIYSTFLQRAYDQILEDVCLQNLPVTFCIDRAGIVGADGETHHGIFDISYLNHMPNMVIMSPKNEKEFKNMLEFSLTLNSPCAIRYPRGIPSEIISCAKIELGKSEILKTGNDIDIWAFGNMTDTALKTAEILKEKNINAGVVNLRFITPIDKDALTKSASQHKMIVTLEDNVLSGGLGVQIDALLINEDVEVINIGWPDSFIEHGTTTELYHEYKMDPEGISERILKQIER